MKKDFPNWRRAGMATGIGAVFLLLAPASQADFVNGNFATGDFTGWTESALNVPGSGMTGTFPPVTEADLQLTGGTAPMSAVLPTGSASSTGGMLAWSGHAARVHDEVAGSSNRASAIEQTITVAAGDVDADGKVHVRFTAASVLEDPSHSPRQQPYFFIEISKAGQSLYHSYNFAGEPGVPWQTQGIHKFTDWQAFDVALDANDVGVGDTLKLKVIGAGCSQSGHAGSIYVRDVRTSRNVRGPSLWITANAPAQVCTGQPVTYSYTYENNGTVPMFNVMVEVEMPETDAPSVADFISISNPSFGGGACTAPVNPGDPALCNIGTLQPGESGTFTMQVTVPVGVVATTLNNGNYTISGNESSATGTLITQLGPLVRSALDTTCAIPRAAPALVPTLGQWGLILLGLTMLGAGLVSGRHRFD